MVIDENTKVIGRFHTKPSARGLNIYNPFFGEVGVNAVYVLFYDEEVKKLVDGFKNLNLFAAITAGFESNADLPTFLDEIDDTAKYVGRVGFIKNDGGKLNGFYQGGAGMYRTLLQVSKIDGAKIAIVGAGNVSKGLINEISRKGHNCHIDIYNRDINKANKIKNKFEFVENTFGLNDFGNKKYDVLVNLTDIGGSEEDKLFNENNVSYFDAVVDVTFEKENTNLIEISKKLGKKHATGWDMFANQGLVILEELFNKDFEFDIFKKHVVNGLTSVVK